MRLSLYSKKYFVCFHFHHFLNACIFFMHTRIHRMRCYSIHCTIQYNTVQYNTIHNLKLNTTCQRLLAEPITFLGSTRSKGIASFPFDVTPPTKYTLRLRVRVYHKHSLAQSLTRSLVRLFVRSFDQLSFNQLTHLNGSRRGEARQGKNRKQDSKQIFYHSMNSIYTFATCQPARPPSCLSFFFSSFIFFFLLSFLI